jgi:5-oxoprolinase (ATP-hydrolysing)
MTVGEFREEALLMGARYAVRILPQSINDLKAQVAANEMRVAELGKMIAAFGQDVVDVYMGHVQTTRPKVRAMS